MGRAERQLASARKVQARDSDSTVWGGRRAAVREVAALDQGDQIVAATGHAAQRLDELLAAQQETNRLLQALLDRG